MKDIYDIKGVENFIGGDFVFYPFLLIFFFLLFFMILNLYFKNNKINKKTEKEPKIKYEYIILDKLIKLEEKCKKMTKNIFYFEINKIFRDYIGYIYNKNFLKSTFEEIKLEVLLAEKENKKLLLLFEKSYGIEFLEKEDTIKKREKMLISFQDIIKNI